MVFSLVNEEIVGYIIHYSNFHSEHLKSYNKLKSHSIKKSKSIQHNKSTMHLNTNQHIEVIKPNIDVVGSKIDTQIKKILIE